MRLLMHTSFLVTTSLSSLTIAHLHILITLLVSVFLVFTAAALGLEIFTASIGIFALLLDTSGLLGASHLLIFTLSLSFSFLFCKLLLEMLFELHFFGTVVGAIVLNDVGFRLLGWEFGWC